jgi:hypothetical protein
VKKPKELTPDEMDRIGMMNAAFGSPTKLPKHSQNKPEKTKTKKKVKIKKKVK